MLKTKTPLYQNQQNQLFPSLDRHFVCTSGKAIDFAGFKTVRISIDKPTAPQLISHPINQTTTTPIPTTNICPAGWRLPTGEPTTGEFTALNTAINGALTNTDAGLRTNGLLQRSGYWNNGFSNQGNNGYYWSSSQYSSGSAHNLYFSSTLVYPAYIFTKGYGFAVRCVAL